MPGKNSGVTKSGDKIEDIKKWENCSKNGDIGCKRTVNFLKLKKNDMKSSIYRKIIPIKKLHKI